MSQLDYYVIRTSDGWAVRQTCGVTSRSYRSMSEALDVARAEAVRVFEGQGRSTCVCIERGDGGWIEDVVFGKSDVPR